MRWEDERYVRLYTRDTPEEVALEWEARALWREMLRKFDRAGILELGKAGMRGLAGLTRMPLEVVERNLPVLLEDGRVRMVGSALVCPNYIAANETPSSSTLRSREWRARSREVDAAAALGAIPDTASRNVPAGDETSPNGTRGDAAGRAGTPCRAVPCRAEPDPEIPAPAGPGPSPGSPPPPADGPLFGAPLTGKAEDKPAKAPTPLDRIFGAYLEGWHRVIHGTRPPALDDKRRKLITARLRDFPPEDLERAAAGIWQSAWNLEEPSRRISLEIALKSSANIERFRDQPDEAQPLALEATDGTASMAAKLAAMASAEAL